ncbi:MAG: GGDEF domain-containing protein, partial [Pseudomonadota bacterium]
LVYAAHASITAFFAVQGNVPAGLHATTVFASLALLPVAYLFLAVKPNRTVSDIAFAAAHLALVIVAAVRTVLLLVAPQWLEGSIMVSQVLWPGVFTASGIFAITGYMEEAQAELLRKALRDPLTSLLNRRGFGEAIERALTKARAKGQNWALIFVDIDHFKSINDRFGHDTGDSVIQAVAKALREELLAGEELARYGGEEFLLFVPVDDEHALSARAERLRQAVSRLAVGPDEERLSASLGVARRSVDASFESVFKLADETLHRAKANGRDRVEYAVDELAGSQPA